MNIYHITHSPQVGIVHLHFWGCNLNCRACLLKKEVYDCHLAETRKGIFKSAGEIRQTPERFLELAEVLRILRKLAVKQVVFMGAEAAIDPEMPQLAKALHKEFSSYNVLLTNGFALADTMDIDEVVFSIKAYNSQLHRDYTGKANKKALNNFIRYHKSGVKLRAESVFIPGYIDCPEIARISRFIGSVNRSIPYRIDAYIPIGDNPWRRPTLEEMTAAVSSAQKYLDSVSCLTGNEALKFEVLRVI